MTRFFLLMILWVAVGTCSFAVREQAALAIMFIVIAGLSTGPLLFVKTEDRRLQLISLRMVFYAYHFSAISNPNNKQPIVLEKIHALI